MRRTVVYLACPMRKGLWSFNVWRASFAAHDMRRKGYSVFNPIGSWLEDLIEHMDIEDWLLNDFGLILKSDCLVRLPGESEGADREMDFAVRSHIRVFNSIIDTRGDIPLFYTEMYQEVRSEVQDD